MPIREFNDPSGALWQAWRVVPTVGSAPAWPGPERRTEMPPEPMLERRRQEVVRRRILTEELRDGWLCFEGAGEKRRLTPVPDDWERCSEPRLLAYWAEAEVVQPRELSPPLAREPSPGRT